MFATIAQHLRFFINVKLSKIGVLSLASTLLFTLITSNTKAQTCSSLFEVTSPFSKLSAQDQEVLTALAQKQVEVTYDFNISNEQKNMVLVKIQDEIHQLVIESGFTKSEIEAFSREYRALIYSIQSQYESSAAFQQTIHSTTSKQKSLDNQSKMMDTKRREQYLLNKYEVDTFEKVLTNIIEGKDNQATIANKTLTQQHIEDFIFALKNIKDINFIVYEYEMRQAGVYVHSQITLLRRAIQLNQYELVKILIENNADIRLVSRDGTTALHDCITDSENIIHIEIAKLLIRNGADVNIRVESSTLLDMASKLQDAELKELLISKGAKHSFSGKIIEFFRKRSNATP